MKKKDIKDFTLDELKKKIEDLGEKNLEQLSYFIGFIKKV